MGRRDFIGGGFELEDVDGSFARFVKDAPKVMRQSLYLAVDKTAFAVSRRIESSAPVGPDSPHLRDTVTWKRRGLAAEIGYRAGQGGDQISKPDAVEWKGIALTNAFVALLNEYKHDAFMRPALENESGNFIKNAKAALSDVERDLSGGGGLL